MRKDSVWHNRTGGYIETISPSGYDVLINGSNRYLNFNTISGSTGYGIRDNAGRMEFKHSGDAWTEFGAGGGGAVDSVNGQTGVVVLDTGDIAEATDFNYVSDAQLTVIGNTSGTNTGDNATNSQYSGLAASKANVAGSLTQFIGNTAWRVFYSDSAGDIVELALGADGTFLKSNGASSAPTFATPAGSGDVSKVGTPVNNQVGVWTGDGTIEGDVDLTFDTTTNTLTTVNVNATTFTGALTGNVTGNVSGSAGSATGNAGTATTLANTRTIWGQNFNGSANVTGTLALGTADLTLTGSIGATGARSTKGWFTDLESTNAPTAGGVAIPTISSTNTFTNKRITKRTSTEASSATPTINTDNVDFHSITALALAITSFTTNLSGTPTTGQLLWIAITDNGTARAITWGASFQASGTIALPTTTVISTRLDVGFIWTGSIWRCIATA